MLPLIFALPCITFMLPRGMKTVRQEQAVAEGVAIIPGLSIGQVLRGYRYWLMAVTGFVVGVGIGGLVINFVPLLVDRGFSPLQAAQMFSAFGACVIIGRLASGWLMDRFWAPAVGCVFLLLPAVGVLLLVGTGTGYLLMVAIVFIALASGGEFDLIAYLCSRYFGTRNFSALYAGQYAIFACGAGIAPGVLGAVRDRVGTYDPALYAIAVMFAVSAVALLGMGRYTFSAAEAR
jgi:fucose permease